MSQYRMNFDNEILLELKDISSLLAAAEKVNVFTVPQDYFENISDTFYSQHQFPSLSQEESKALEVPEGYFNNLSAQILEKIRSTGENSISGDIELSALLQQAQPLKTFQVPAEYFSNLSHSILDAVYKDEEMAAASFLYQNSNLRYAGANNIFEVADNYFETLPFAITNKIDSLSINLDAEEKLSDLLEAAKNNTIFTLPTGYFEDLSSHIITKIKNNGDAIEIGETLSIELENIRQIQVFTVPENYFTNLSSVIIDKIKMEAGESAIEEIAIISPLLHSVQKRSVFEVPMGYFENFTVVSTPVSLPAKAKVVIMPARVNFKRLAAAAIITALLATGIYNYSSRQARSTQVAAVTSTNYITVDSAVEKGKKINGQQFDEAINNLSKEDVINYLEKNNSDEDLALLTAGLDENTLPDKDDYLLDEKTLENYMEVIKSQN